MDAQKRQKTPKNTAIYVTGLPKDTTFNEVVSFFSKCGIIMDEISTGKPRVKLYAEEGDSEALKGDALIVYLREESVTLACQLFDDCDFRLGGPKISVQPAQQQQQSTNNDLGESEPKRAKIDKETWKRHMRKMQKKLEWFDVEAEAAAKEEAKRARWAKILILKHMYTPKELEADPLEFPLQLSEEITEECQERLGIESCSVKVIEDRAEEGLCSVKFKSDLEALAAQKLMNGRYFDGRRVEATIYDGSFPLSQPKAVTIEDEEARLERFSRFIEGRESDHEESENDDESDEEDDDE